MSALNAAADDAGCTRDLEAVTVIAKDCRNATAGAGESRPPEPPLQAEFPRIPSFGSPDTRGLFSASNHGDLAHDVRMPSFDPADCDTAFEVIGDEAPAGSRGVSLSSAPADAADRHSSPSPASPQTVPSGRPGTIAIPRGLGSDGGCRWQEVKAVSLSNSTNHHCSSSEPSTSDLSTRMPAAHSSWCPDARLPSPPPSEPPGSPPASVSPSGAGTRLEADANSANERAIEPHAETCLRVGACSDEERTVMQPPPVPSRRAPKRQPGPASGPLGGRAAQGRSRPGATGRSRGSLAGRLSLRSLQWPSRGTSKCSSSGGGSWCRWAKCKLGHISAVASACFARRSSAGAELASPSPTSRRQLPKSLKQLGTTKRSLLAASDCPFIEEPETLMDTRACKSEEKTGQPRAASPDLHSSCEETGELKVKTSAADQHRAETLQALLATEKKSCEEREAELLGYRERAAQLSEMGEQEKSRLAAQALASAQQAAQLRASIRTADGHRRQCEEELQRCQSEAEKLSALGVQEAMELRTRIVTAEEQTVQLHESLLLAEGRCRKGEAEVQSRAGEAAAADREAAALQETLAAADRLRQERAGELRKCEQEAVALNAQHTHELAELSAIKSTVRAASGEEAAAAVRLRTLSTALESAEQRRIEREEELDKQRRVTEELFARRARRLSQPHIVQALAGISTNPPRRSSEFGSPSGNAIASCDEPMHKELKDLSAPRRASIAALKERFQVLDERHRRDLSLLLPGGQQAALIAGRSDLKAAAAAAGDGSWQGSRDKLQGKGDAGPPESYASADASTSSGLRCDASSLSSAMSPVDGVSPGGTPSSCGFGNVFGLEGTTEPAEVVEALQNVDEGRLSAAVPSAPPGHLGGLSIAALPGAPGQRLLSTSRTPTAPWEEDVDLKPRPGAAGCQAEAREDAELKPRPRPRKLRTSVTEATSRPEGGEADARVAMITTAAKKRPKRKPVRGQNISGQSPTKLTPVEAQLAQLLQAPLGDLEFEKVEEDVPEVPWSPAGTASERPQPGAKRRSRSASRRWPRTRASSKSSQVEADSTGEDDFSFGQEAAVGEAKGGELVS